MINLARAWTKNASLMYFFAGFAMVTALTLAVYARVYPMQALYRAA